MKLVFRKSEALEISVNKKSGDSESGFSYIEMIKELINTQKLDPPDLEGDFSEAEKASINSMVEHINDEVGNFYSDEDDHD